MIFSTGPCDIEMENLSALDRATVRGGEVYPAWAGPHPFTARQYSRTLGLGLMTCGCGLSLWMINGYQSTLNRSPIRRFVDKSARSVSAIFSACNVPSEKGRFGFSGTYR